MTDRPKLHLATQSGKTEPDKPADVSAMMEVARRKRIARMEKQEADFRAYEEYFKAHLQESTDRLTAIQHVTMELRALSGCVARLAIAVERVGERLPVHPQHIGSGPQRPED